MKTKVMMWLLAMMPWGVWAQQPDNTAQQYAMRYVKDHFFMQNGEDFNVVDTDIEWPEVLYYYRPRVLQQQLLKLMFAAEDADFDSAYAAFVGKHGRPVTGLLKEIPDDHRFCYTTVSAKVISYHPGRWISYVVDSETKPEKRSGMNARKVRKYLTYDISGRQVLDADDMLRQDAIQLGEADPGFFDAVLSPLTDEDAEHLVQIHVEGVWLENSGEVLGMHLVCTTMFRELSYDVRIPYQDNKYLTTKACKRLLKKKVDAPVPEYVVAPQTWRGDSVYKSAEVMPEFKGGKEGLNNYLRNIDPPLQSKPGRVFVSYVVDKNGRTQDARVVDPLTPELDRHAIGIVRGMPAYTPASRQGRPLCVRMYIPIYYK